MQKILKQKDLALKLIPTNIKKKIFSTPPDQVSVLHHPRKLSFNKNPLPLLRGEYSFYIIPTSRPLTGDRQK